MSKLDNEPKVYQEFGDLLRNILDTYDITVQEVSAEIGPSDYAIYQYRTGRRRPRYRKWIDDLKRAFPQISNEEIDRLKVVWRVDTRKNVPLIEKTPPVIQKRSNVDDTLSANPRLTFAPPAVPTSYGLIVCPQCQDKAILGEAFCDNCGEPLNAPAKTVTQTLISKMSTVSLGQSHSPPSEELDIHTEEELNELLDELVNAATQVAKREAVYEKEENVYEKKEQRLKRVIDFISQEHNVEVGREMAKYIMYYLQSRTVLSFKLGSIEISGPKLYEFVYRQGYEEFTGYCFRCRTKRRVLNPQKELSETGQPMVRGKCSVCGTGMITFYHLTNL